jgi:hypothetical protein
MRDLRSRAACGALAAGWWEVVVRGAQRRVGGEVTLMLPIERVCLWILVIYTIAEVFIKTSPEEAAANLASWIHAIQ